MGSCNSCSGGTCGTGGGNHSEVEGECMPYDKKKVKKLSRHDVEMTYG
ncbi:MAG: hypothetical protein V3R93_01435 [Candidatus Hydrothermarchaeaceae archaeon]